MSEVHSRPSGSRGRGTYRGGRGGHSHRGGRGTMKTTTKSEDENIPPPLSYEEEGDIGELKKKYAGKVPMLQEMFPDWTTEDIVFTLDETNGDETAAIDRITEGSASQWGEVKKKHVDRTRSKVKESTPATNDIAGSMRGRGRGGIESRGRGRGDRGRGRGGRAGAQQNGTRTTDKPAKTTGDGWGDTATASEVTGPWEIVAEMAKPSWETPTNGDATTSSDWATAEPVMLKEESLEEPKGLAKPASKPTAWSSLFAKPPPVKAAPKRSIVEPSIPTLAFEVPSQEDLPDGSLEDTLTDEASQSVIEPPLFEPALTLTPSKDELTEVNLEQLPDVSHPPQTQTAISTVASTQDPHSQLTSANPLTRPGMSGFATSALKATAQGARSASFQRKVMEQQEAVVMPGDRAVDRAAVQFGSMGLNGSSDDLDADEDRETPETRAQPPNDSPVAPRASLPPVPMPQHQSPQMQQSSEPMSVARPAPGLPPAPHQQSPQQASAYGDYSRYGQSAPKAYDPFGQQSAPAPAPAPAQSQDSFSASNSQAQPPTSAAPSDYSSFYGANQQRDPYNSNYYNNYMHNQESQQRSGSAFGSSAQETPSQYATSQMQGRYGQQEATSSGDNTPNPVNQAQQQHQPQAQAQAQSQSQTQNQPTPQGQTAPGGYPYGYPNASYQQYPQYNQYMSQMHQNQQQHQPHQYGRNRPMFDDARRYEDGSSYMAHGSHYQYGGQYGGSYGKPGNMYGQQPQHQQYGGYGEHAASPAATSGFAPSSMSARDSGYRTGSAQPSEAQQSSSAFGGMSDPFGRAQSGFGGQQQSLGQQTGSEDASKPGPSPSLGQVNRPESATNNMSVQQGGQSSGFPPPQSQQGAQQAFGGYPQYGGLGGLAGHQGGQGHQQTYGSYGAGQGFGGYGYGNTANRGWGGQYGGH